MVLAAPLAQAIEIDVNGHHYASLQAYLASKGAVKTKAMNRKEPSGQDLHQLYVLGIEYGVIDALRDFYKTKGKPDFQEARRISPRELQEALQQEVTQTKEAKLLISSPGKLRILGLK